MVKKIFDPFYVMGIYFFFIITSLHLEVPLFVRLHLESLLALSVLFLFAVEAIFKNKIVWQWSEPLFVGGLISLLIICSPLLTSFYKSPIPLQILEDPEFRDLSKVLLISATLLHYSHTSRREIIVNVICCFYTLFALYFLYRYFIMGEVRDFDLRPMLAIRHGDPNFLATFFTMISPLCLMKAHYYYMNKQFHYCLIFLLQAFLLIFCSLLTQSRMAIIAIFMAALYLIFKKRNWVKYRPLLLATVVIIALAANYKGSEILNRFIHISDKSNIDRIATLKNGIILFFENPLLGVGMHEAKNSFFMNTSFPHFQTDFAALEVHNSFLEVAAELGIFGVFCYGTLCIWTLIQTFRTNHYGKDYLQASLLALTLCALSIGISYKDLIMLHLFTILMLSYGNQTGFYPLNKFEG